MQKQVRRKQSSQKRSMEKNSSVSLSDPSLYINRELSWLEFNERVLEEVQDSRNPLLERVKFHVFSVSSDTDGTPVPLCVHQRAFTLRRGCRFVNSQPILPFSSLSVASNGRPFFEMNRFRMSLLPSISILRIWS
jgi:polyphosphate kinase-like protein